MYRSPVSIVDTYVFVLKDTTNPHFLLFIHYLRPDACITVGSLTEMVNVSRYHSYLKMLKFLDQLVRRHMKFGIPKE